MQNLPKEKFKSIFIHENDVIETQSCEICCERFGSPENNIVFCDLCNLAVHQFCYGYPLSEEIPEGTKIISKILYFSLCFRGLVLRSLQILHGK